MRDPSRDEPTAPHEDALLRDARRGDLNCFNSLVELHQHAVYNLCLRMLGSPAAAEDAAQDAFLSAFRRIESLKGDTFRPWLMRIAANACTDELRRRSRRPALSLDTGNEDEMPLDVADPAPGPEVEALRAESEARVQAALLRLPHDQRVAVIMCDVQGFAYEEIAASMRTSIGTVKSRIARGRDKLRRELGARREEQISDV
jgi:RNA polymerase sigma-70 factor (ECF subfamily)